MDQPSADQPRKPMAATKCVDCDGTAVSDGSGAPGQAREGRPGPKCARHGYAQTELAPAVDTAVIATMTRDIDPPTSIVTPTYLAQNAITALSRWIDESPANAKRDPESLTWGRLAKVAEETGEAIAAYIGFTNQNPRKGTTHSMADVKKELLDVALTALCAYEHLTDHDGDSLVEFLSFALSRHARAMTGLEAVDG